MRAPTDNNDKSTTRAWLIRVAVAIFACRALIPAGFMPAALAEGGPVVICHGGLVGEFFRGLAATGASPGTDMPEDAGTAGHSSGHQQSHPNSLPPSEPAGHAEHTADTATGGMGDAHDQAVEHHLDYPAAHDHAGDQADPSHEAWEHCPVGAASAAVPIPQDYDFSLPATEHVLGHAEPQILAPADVTAGYRARAPPIAFSRLTI